MLHTKTLVWLQCLVIGVSWSDDGPIVQLPGGAVRGIAHDGGGMKRAVAAFPAIPYAAPPVGDLRWRPPQHPAPWRPRVLPPVFNDGCPQVKHSHPPHAIGSEDCLYLSLFAPLSHLNSTLKDGGLPTLLWVHGGGYQVGSGTGNDTNGTYNVGNLDQPMIIVAINYRLNVFGFAASDSLRSRDPEGSTGNYGVLDQRFAMRWCADNIARFGGDPKRVFIAGQSAGGEAIGEHLVRPKSWGLFSAAGLESGAFYRMSPPTAASAKTIPCHGPSPGNVTVRDQNDRWASMMHLLGCANGDDMGCALNASTEQLLHSGDEPQWGQMQCGWVPAIDGVDLREESVMLARKGKMAPGVTVVAGSTMEDGFIVPNNCADPSTCSESDFRRWISEGYGFNSSETERAVNVYSDESVRKNLTIGQNATKWYWAQVHAGADAQSTCPARRLARWVTQAGQGRRAYWYYWEYPPKDPQTGASEPAAHCSELKFLWGLRCGANWTAGKPWAAKQCSFGLQFASFWQSFAARGDPSLGPVEWPAFGASAGASGADGGGGTAMVITDGMALEAQKNLRQSRCDLWDAHFHP